MENPQGFQTTKRAVKTCIPTTIEMPIREMDWCRLYRSIQSLPADGSGYKQAAYFFWGVGLSSLTSVMPDYQSLIKNPMWSGWIVISIASVAFIVGFLLSWFGSIQKKSFSFSVDAVKKDMEEIYENFFPSERLKTRMSK